ncbi:hypothetical protein AWB67_07500 [Caballeronia terrestris]|uniref:Uncharacterized protein n=1 Tax=Caballeronia terrestris TaxID=1226301 RepID=A0A158L3E5_9BURK|nr:hypothetical protein AWB67_07500 [Caballeronia terrestris]
MDALHPEILALVIDAMHLRGIGEHAGGRVAHARAVLPAAFPELVDDVHVLVGDVVALVARGDLVLAEHLHAALGEPRDDVPADAPARQMIERRHAPREHVGRLVIGVARHAQAEIARGVGHRGERHERVLLGHLRAMTQGGVDVAAVHVVYADAVGHEQRVDQAAFQRLREIDPVIERVVLERTVARMPPHARRVMHRAMQRKRVDADLLLRIRCGGSHRYGLSPLIVTR